MDNNQTIPFVNDTISPVYCIAAALRIWRRVHWLKINPAKPIKFFIDTKNSTPQYINDVHITQLLQLSAKLAHNITRKADLAHFPTHSIRVEMCLFFQSQGATVFMLYLRNIVALTEHHHHVIRNA